MRTSNLTIELLNVSDSPVKSVEVELTIVDRLRKTVVDRLFVEVYDWGLGDRSIKPGKSKRFVVPIEYRVPLGAGDGYGTYSCVRLRADQHRALQERRNLETRGS